jgi:serine protease AprX
MKRTLNAFILLLVGCSVFFGANAKLSPDLQTAPAAATVRVVVQYTNPSQNQVSLGNLVGGVVNGVTSTVAPVTTILGLGGVVNFVSDLLNIVVCSLPVSQLNALTQNPNVVYVSLDRTLGARLDYTAAAVNAGSLWKANLSGAGIGVAVIDSGVAQTPDLAFLGLLPHIVYSKDFTGGNGTDQYGHGTHVAGIVGATGAASHCLGCTRSLVGMAPNASIINLRVLDANGQGSDSYLIAAIDQAIQLKNVYNIRVINLSLGRPIFESYKLDPLCQAVEAAWRAGITVVVAAGNDGRDNSMGNDGYGTIESPGNDPYVITVGAMKAMETYTRTDDLVASYSSKGPSAIDHVVKPDIVAPGNHVVSLLSPNSTLAAESANAVPLSYYQVGGSSTPSTSFLMLNGTSMSTPVVSGVIADLLQAHPSLTPDQIKARLMKTAYKTFPTTSTAVDPVTGQTFTSQYDIFTIGAGYLDAAAALTNTDVANGTAMSPIATYEATSGQVYLTYDPSSIWNNTNASAKTTAAPASVWGTNSVWGNVVVDADKTVWGAASVWGNSSIAAFKTVWGASGVWADKTVWGAATTSANKTVWGADSSTSDSDTNFAINHP